MKLRIVIGMVLVLVLSFAVLRAGAEEKSGATGKATVYVGTYSIRGSEGIYRFEMDLATGKLTGRAVAAQAKNPSFLAIHPNHKFLYAVGETEEFKGKKTGIVSAFAIDSKTGNLKLLDQEASEGAAPCYLVVDKAGKNVLVANYTGGSVAVLPIVASGKVEKASCAIQHKGSGADPDRQKEPHAHSINLDAANRFAFAADLGLDKVLIYRFDPAKGKLTANDPPYVQMAPASGPRHFAFHPSGKYAYVINEIACTITAMAYDAEKGKLTKLQTLTTLPRPIEKGDSTAEVQVHPSGKWVYGSNRGQNSIAVFKVDEKTGELSPVGHQGKGIKTPRGFGIDPTGKFLLAANQDGDSILVFRIDQKTGELQPTDISVEVPSPVCVKFLPR